MKIINTTFKGNHIVNTSTVTYYYGGAIYGLNNILNITGSIFTNNSANIFQYDNDAEDENSSKGGTIYCGNTKLYISNSTFSNNYAISLGGTITTYNGVTLINKTNFINNLLSKEEAMTNIITTTGGTIAFYTTNVTIHDSNFNKSSARIGGFIHQFNGNLGIYGTNFTKGSAFSHPISDNSSSAVEWALYIFSILNVFKTTIYNSKFDNCVSTGTGMVILSTVYGLGVYGNLDIYNSSFTNNYRIFNPNVAASYVIQTLNNNLNIENCSFKNNSGILGVVNDEDNSIISLKNSNFTNNSGGIIVLGERNVKMNIFNCNFVNNTAVFVTLFNIGGCNIFNSSFSDNIL